MNVYDFDGTIYRGDSSIDFYLFCIRRRPRVLTSLPAFCIAAAKYRMRYIEKTELKELFFSFLKRVPNPEKEIALFWDSRWNRISDWYYKVHAGDDVVISASPTFLVERACSRLGVVNVIASEVDMHTGEFLSKNCHGVEKVRRFAEKYSLDCIDQFFSDSVSADAPLALYAKNAWLVAGGKVVPWPTTEERQ